MFHRVALVRAGVCNALCAQRRLTFCVFFAGCVKRTSRLDHNPNPSFLFDEEFTPQRFRPTDQEPVQILPRSVGIQHSNKCICEISVKLSKGHCLETKRDEHRPFQLVANSTRDLCSCHDVAEQWDKRVVLEQACHVEEQPANADQAMHSTEERIVCCDVGEQQRSHSEEQRAKQQLVDIER